MANLSEIKALVMEPTVSESSALPSHVLQSLPPEITVDDDDDDSTAGGIHRDTDPSACMTFEKLKRAEIK